MNNQLTDEQIRQSINDLQTVVVSLAKDVRCLRKDVDVLRARDNERELNNR